MEILVVDNGSAQRQWSLLRRGVKSMKFGVRLIRNRENFGYAKANNLAAGKARGSLLVFLNNDVIVTRGWLRPLVAFLQRRPDVVACQPKLKSAIEAEYFDYAGGAGGFLDMFGYPFTRGRVFDRIEKDLGQYETQAEITWASGACFIIRTDIFHLFGGFDEFFFAYMEEIDLSVRMRQEGFRIFCLPESTVFHYGAYTSNRDLPRKIFMNHRNNLYFVMKHYSLWPFFPILLIRWVFDFFSAIHYLVEGRPGFVVSLLRAHVRLLIWLPRLVSRGVITLTGKSLSRNPTVYRGSSVIDYFLLGKENYDRILGNESGIRRSYKRYIDVTYFEPHGPTPSPTRI